MEKSLSEYPDINIEDIQLIVYDFDGVMTDNKVLVFDDGREAVFCNRSDGFAIQKLQELGIPQIILSTEKTGVVKSRARKLNIEVIYGVDDKLVTLKEYCDRRKYDYKKVLYIGNDLNDLEAMKIVGYPVTPKDANGQIRKISKLILNTKGGDGVVRELYERIIK
jgi:YrbI family 3-deoxy-D-manno-octulosonate 8-phosphate phosphatase